MGVKKKKSKERSDANALRGESRMSFSKRFQKRGGFVSIDIFGNI